MKFKALLTTFLMLMMLSILAGCGGDDKHIYLDDYLDGDQSVTEDDFVSDMNAATYSMTADGEAAAFRSVMANSDSVYVEDVLISLNNSSWTDVETVQSDLSARTADELLDYLETLELMEPEIFESMALVIENLTESKFEKVKKVIETAQELGFSKAADSAQGIIDGNDSDDDDDDGNGGGTPSEMTGAELYQEYCLSCHGSLEFSNILVKTAEEFDHHIQAGTGGMGTDELKALTEEQLQSIADALNGDTGESPAAKSGEELYLEYCKSCHGIIEFNNILVKTVEEFKLHIRSNTGGMGSDELKALTDEQLQAIADAL